MTTQHTIYHQANIYDVTVRDNTIIRVVKYIGDTQTPRTVDFDELSLAEQNAIIFDLLNDEEA